MDRQIESVFVLGLHIQKQPQFLAGTFPTHQTTATGLIAVTVDLHHLIQKWQQRLDPIRLEPASSQIIQELLRQVMTGPGNAVKDRLPDV